MTEKDHQEIMALVDHYMCAPLKAVRAKLESRLREVVAPPVPEPGERERFEAWYFNRYMAGIRKQEDGQYAFIQDRDMWEAWQAARAPLPPAPTKGTE